MNKLQRGLIAFTSSLAAACGGGGSDGGGGGSGVQAPSNFVFPAVDSIYLNDITIAPNIPTYNGTVDAFSVSPPLPAGLAVHPLVGAVFGTPTEAAARKAYTITASNAGGSASFAVTITVVAPPRFVYVLADDGTISIFTDNPVTGRVRRKGYVAAPAGDAGPEELVIHPNQRFAYVPNLSSGNISVYTIAPVSGWLTPGTSVATGPGQHRLAIDPTGKWAFVAGQVADEIRVYAISATTGALTEVGSPVAAGTQPSALALDAAGKYLFVALRGDPSTGAGSALAVFGVNLSTGALTPNGTPFPMASSKPVGIAVDPVKSELYVIEEGTNSVSALRFDPSNGAITSIGVDATGIQPAGVSGHPSGKFAYVANADPSASKGSISIFTVDPNSGDMTPAGSAECGIRPGGIVVDPTGKFAYVAGHDSNDLRQFKIHAQTGALTLEDELVTRAGPVDVAIVQSFHLQTLVPRYAYVTNGGSNDISSFAINPQNGELTEITPSVSTGMTPVSVTTDPQQRYLYVANQLSSNISIYSPSPTSGTLFEVAQPAAVSGKPTHLVVEPSGRFLYITARGQVNPDAGLLMTYAINQTSGALTPLDVQFIDPRPLWLLTDVTGQYLYVACAGLDDGTDANIRRFSLPVTTGIPQNSMSSDATPTVSSLGLHPNGKYLYATLKGTANTTRQFSIDPQSGALSSVGTPVSFGVEPAGVEVTPDGRFAYVAYTHVVGLGHVAGFEVDPETGGLTTPPDLTQDGPHPSALAIDGTGRFLYVTNIGSNDISVMQIISESGQLVVGEPEMTGIGPSAVLVLLLPQ